MNKVTSYGMTAVVWSLFAVAPAHAAPTTHEVTVQSSFGTTFTDCFRFDTPAVGDLTIDLLGSVLTSRGGERDTVGGRFKAVTRDDAFEIMFFGRFRDRRAQLEGGEAVNEFGDTCIFLGHINEACSTTASTGTERKVNPYAR